MAMTWACETVDLSNSIVSWILALAVPFASVPQWMKQCRMRSHLGLSLNNFQAGALCSWLNCLVFVVRQYDTTFSCCSARQKFIHCMGALAPVVQLFFSWVGAMIVLVLYFVHFDPAGCERIGRDPIQELKASKLQFAALIGTIALTLALPTTVALFAGSFESNGVKLCCDALTVIMYVLLVSHWSLQIRETCVVRGAGTFSTVAIRVSICSAAVGVVVFLHRKAYAQVLMFALVTIMQSAALIVALYFEHGYELLSQSSSDAEEELMTCSSRKG